jgi:excisionase family DNA binding protein
MGDAIRWLKVREAADRARCGPKTIYRAVRSGRLRAARIGGRRELRFLDSWIDLWLFGQDKDWPEGRHATEREAGAASNMNAGPNARLGSRSDPL